MANVKKLRRCLRCQQYFTSTCSAHRICPKCRKAWNRLEQPYVDWFDDPHLNKVADSIIDLMDR